MGVDVGIHVLYRVRSFAELFVLDCSVETLEPLLFGTLGGIMGEGDQICFVLGIRPGVAYRARMFWTMHLLQVKQFQCVVASGSAVCLSVPELG